jgi:hypothetical protein
MNRIWLSTAALTIGLVLGAGTATLTLGQQPPMEPPAAQQRPPMAQGKFQHIHTAERALQHAEGSLEKAAHHFGGHRAKALQLVKQAEGELKEALAYANAHPEEFKEGTGTPASK